jgi:hypothetical protein
MSRLAEKRRKVLSTAITIWWIYISCNPGVEASNPGPVPSLEVTAVTCRGKVRVTVSRFVGSQLKGVDEKRSNTDNEMSLDESSLHSGDARKPHEKANTDEYELVKVPLVSHTLGITMFRQSLSYAYYLLSIQPLFESRC